MKLLKIELENLNSLYGRHCVDFEKDLLGAPLFLIMGPTGAGKSTLMDAMSLALFGQTPRLVKGKSDKDPENDCRQIMSRGTAIAFAQLAFSKFEKGVVEKYRATWQCERAYKKPEGNFKDPRRILEQLNKVTNDWEQLISDHRPKFYEPYFNKVLENLTVDDFKRMVLLAQGEFAAFLKANEDERAAILERLTNTEKYKEIGKKAAEKKKILEDKLNEAKAKLNGLSLLSQDEEEVLVNENQELAKDICYAKETLELLNNDIEWFDQEQNYLKKLNDAEEEFYSYEKKYLDNKDNLDKLEKYKKFSKAIDYINKVNDSQCVLQSIKNSIMVCKSEIKENESHILFINNNIKYLNEKFELAKNELSHKKNDIENAKKIRTQKASFESELNIKSKQIFKKENEIIKIKEQILSAEKYIQNIINNKNELKTALIKDYKALLESYSFFLIDFDTNKREFEKLKGELIDISLPLERPQEKLALFFQEKDHLLKDKQEIKSTLIHVENIQRKEEELINFVKIREEIKKKHENELNELAFKKERFENDNKDIFHLKNEASNLSWRISLAQQRRHLHSGEECPLCGSQEHPYFKDTSYKLADMEVIDKHSFLSFQLKDKEAAQHHFALGLGALEKSVLTCEQEIKKTEEQILTLNEFIMSKIQFIIDHFNKKEDFILNGKSNGNNLFHYLKKIEEQNEKKLSLIEEKIASLNKKIDNYNNLKEEYLIFKEKNNQYLRKKQDYIDSLLCLDSKINIQEISVNNVKEDSKYDVSYFDNKNYASLVKDVEKTTLKLNNEYLSLQKENLMLEKILSDFKNEKILLDKSIFCLEKEMISILNGKDPYLLEEELNKEIFDKNISIQNEHKKLHEKERNFAVLNNKLAHFYEQENQLQQNISLFENLLSSEKSKFNIDNKDEILLFDLDEKSISYFNEIFTKLEILRITSSENKLQREKDLFSHRDQKKTHSTGKENIELKAERDSILHKLDEIKNKKASVQAKILSNEENKKKSSQYISEVDELQNDFTVWQKLHQIIGINDGDKFKRFAQILNLEELIGKANYHLARFEKRYTLSPALDADNNPRLAFAIKDSYHANEIRSFKTLSGGETFLVSLALALALADYRTVKMPIETILLDEGFGTLDPATLQVAMGALESLHSNGTQVGIISHVEALKESIGARIILEKQGNGHSSIRIEV